jgi:hypothetical protein
MKTLNTYTLRFTGLALLFLATLFVPVNTYAMDVSFQWTANPDQITGYKLYYKQGASSAPPYTGTGIKEGDAPILLGRITNYTVTNLNPDKTYHFVLSAYNSDGESGFSKVVTINPSPTINSISKN